ncbi:hypothetical protein RhiJN_12148 [Ceratobasidium sp. AG-Ba]|nr:hypothetical protein RhiJN_12148 [Ceratobasidium sp. AG-Ba]
MFVLHRRYGHRILSKTWFELLCLFLWALWLGGAASAAALWPNLNWCQIYKPCRILVALMAFAWMGDLAYLPPHRHALRFIHSWSVVRSHTWRMEL